MKKNILISMLSIIILIISSCGDNGTNPSSNNEILPLKIGNYWKFDSFNYDTSGNIKSQTVVTFKILSDTIIKNERFFNMYAESGNVESKLNGLINRNDGLYIFDGTDISLLFKYPATKGEKFNTQDDEVVVESANYNYVTTIGNFSSYQYAMIESYKKEYVYFKPGVGYVADENFYYTDGGRLYLKNKYVLKEYKVN